MHFYLHRSRLRLGSCLLTFILFTLTLQQEHTISERDVPRSHDQVKGEDVRSESEGTSQWPKRSNDNGDQGGLEVQQALSELQTIEPPRSRNLLLDKSPGFLGTSAYYAKEAFVLLFMNRPNQEDYLESQPNKPRLSRPLDKAVRLLGDAAQKNNSDAIFLLAEMNFFGNYTYPRNYREAFGYYHKLASLTGNSSAQHMVGLMYATGVGNAVERDQARALLHHTFAARQGNTRSEMTLAFRHHTGIGVPRDCNTAASYYKKVAEKAILFAQSGPPGGLSLQKNSYRLADEVGGVYGEGASVVSSGAMANRGGPNSDQHAAFDDVLEYLDLMSRKGDLKATFSLGRLYYDGSRTMRKNLKLSRRYLMTVARTYWTKEGAIISSDENNDTARIASKAAAYLGRMFLRGEGTEQNFDKALTWFKRGVANGDSFCQYEIGLMYLLGLGVRKDALQASDYFKASAEQDFPAAQVELGKLFLDQGDLKTAMTYFELAVRHGHIEAFYHLAETSNNGAGRERSCGLVTAYYKVVAEKAEMIHSSFEEANAAYENGDRDSALPLYIMAAEQGYESSQANVAYMLDEHTSILSFEKLIPWKKQTSSLLQNAALALIYWTRSAKQSNIDSMVKMGDYYLGGYGIEADVEKAASCYQTAADMQQSAQAMWNLGWMHENGIGVEQDYHLAKRYYDQALETNQEAYFPVKLSLLKLRLRSFWNTITNGTIKSIQSEQDPPKYRTWSEWLTNFLADDDDQLPDDYPTEPYIQDTMPGSDDYYDDIDEGLVESLIILGLAGALAFLIYYRQQRQVNYRREADQQQAHVNRQAARDADPAGNVPLVAGQQPNGGFFPPPGDPYHGQWVAGGVGH